MLQPPIETTQLIGNWLFRLHVERGQYYVFLALLVALAFARIRERRDGLGTALMLGLVAAARPTFALIPLPPLLRRETPSRAHRDEVEPLADLWNGDRRPEVARKGGVPELRVVADDREVARPPADPDDGQGDEAERDADDQS